MMSINWLGHACFLLVIDGVRILVDPFLDNPLMPKDVANSDLNADFILCTHGHGDHLGSSIQLMNLPKKTKFVSVVEICDFVISQGISSSRCIGMNKGGTISLSATLSVTMVNAIHTSGIEGPTGTMVYGGEAAGFVIHAPNHSIYHCGDTCVFGDMRIIDELYQPDIALLCIGNFYTMGPKEAAYAVNNLLPHCKTVIPMHFRTFSALTGTAKEFIRLINRSDCEVKVLEPGSPLMMN